jgi:hypothetical protein
MCAWLSVYVCVVVRQGLEEHNNYAVDFIKATKCAPLRLSLSLPPSLSLSVRAPQTAFFSCPGPRLKALRSA